MDTVFVDQGQGTHSSLGDDIRVVPVGTSSLSESDLVKQ